jgi:hypothetical protein
MIGIIAVLVALAGLMISAITDIKTGYVPNLVSHSLIAIGAVFVIFTFPFNDALMIYGLAIAVFAIGFLLYIFGQMGGGDVKLFTAITLLIPFYPVALFPIMNTLGIQPAVPYYPFIVSVYVLFGILFMFVVPLNYLPKIRRIKNKIKDYKRKMRTGTIFCLILLPVFAIWFLYFRALALLAIPMALTLLIIPFKDDIVEHFFAQKKKIKDLDDDDVIALEMLDKDVKKKLSLQRKTLMDKELKKVKALARKHNIKEVIVCEGMPRAVPMILAAVALSLIFGDVLLFLILNA